MALTGDRQFQSQWSGNGTPDDPNLVSLDEIAAYAVPSTSASAAVSIVTSQVASGGLGSIPISTADSKAVSSGLRASISDSKAVSTSANTSVADSKSISNSVNISVADSKATSVGFATIVPTVSGVPGFQQPYATAVVRTANSKMAERVSVTDFGSGVGTGSVTTDMAAFRAAIAVLDAAGGGTLWVPPGVECLVDPDFQSDYPLPEVSRTRCIRPCDNMTLEIDGTIRVPANALANYAAVFIHQRSNVTVCGKGSIIGDNTTHIGALHEGGVGVYVLDSDNITIRHVTCSAFAGDGISVDGDITVAAGDIIAGGGGASTNVRVLGATCDANRRNGMSFIGVAGGLVHGCTFSNTSGLSPQAGFDIEPGAFGVQDVVVFGNYFSNNVTSGCSVTDGGAPPYPKRCALVGNVVAGATVTPIQFSPGALNEGCWGYGNVTIDGTTQTFAPPFDASGDSSVDGDFDVAGRVTITGGHVVTDNNYGFVSLTTGALLKAGMRLNTSNVWEFLDNQSGSFIGDVAFQGSVSRLSTGAAARAGTATLVAGTVTVATTAVTSASMVFVSRKTAGGTLGNLAWSKVDGTSITITSTNAADTSVVDWMLVDKA